MTPPTRLIVGLGNPGGTYEQNRHNIGFWVIDRLAAHHARGGWQNASKFKANVARAHGNLHLAKPQTYMNRSGDSVAALVRFYRLDPAAVLIISDDIDLAFGKVRTRLGGGHGGHNGLRSVIAAIGEGFARVKVGVGRTPAGAPTSAVRADTASHVLGNFGKAEKATMEPLADSIAQCIVEHWGMNPAEDHAAAHKALQAKLGQMPLPSVA
ncbi:MAG: aminoacyl-tRNA hydrolase [Alphaproteobacteria bacterium]|nr:aminoacyl-tRNA hydrolase [Alphaproteobacteria bacterium]